MYLSGNVNAPVGVYVPAALLDAARLHLLDAGFDAPEADSESDSESPASGQPGTPWRAVRIGVGIAAVAAAVYILIVTFLGSATCALRLLC